MLNRIMDIGSWISLKVEAEEESNPGLTLLASVWNVMKKEPMF